MRDISIATIKRDILVPTILQTVTGHPTLKRSGREARGPCPICNRGGLKKSRAFSVSNDGRQWYCFSTCSRGGSVIDLVMALDNCSIADALKRLRDV